MLEGLYSTAAGMAAQTEQLSAIGNDLANLSTSGYHSERIAFSDLLYNPVEESGAVTTAGAGASASAIGRSATQGAVRITGNPLDVAIAGHGYLQVTLANGKAGLTRNGTLAIGAGGMLTDAKGNLLNPPIQVPTGVSESQLKIAADGTVTARGQTLGRIALVNVPSPAHLIASEGGMLSAGAESGQPGAATDAKLQQGALEESNVDLAGEMTLMVTTQRAYQLDASALQNESQMMSIANQLRA